MESLEEHKVYQVQPGRMLDEDEAVKDVIGIGLQHLTEGAKNPIKEFNKVFHNLQKRRQMNPVTKLYEDYLTKSQAQTAAAPTPSPDAPHTNESTSGAGEDPEHRPMSGVEAEAVGGDDFEMGGSEGDIDEPQGELEAILDELARDDVQEPTLQRVSADDVALDMDEEEEEVEDEASDDSSGWESEANVDEASGAE